MKQLLHLAGNEFRLEWRQQTAFTGVVVYVVSTVFISYLSFREIIEISVWNALFWIILVFASVNAIARSFLQDSRGVQLYYYTLVHPAQLIFAKVIYNTCLLFVLAIIHFACFSLFLGNMVQDMAQFAFGVLLGCTALSATLSMVAAIASKASGNATLMAILSFPILIPLVLTIIRFSKNAIDGIAWSVNQEYALAMGGLCCIALALGYLLFPYLWHE